MPDYVKYQQSISMELLSAKDRVRNFIDDKYWGEDGRYKEILFSNILKRHLPKGVSVGTGFVINKGHTTRQIDIIVYRDDYPLLFKQDNFVIATAECVLGIIEVKSRVDTRIGQLAILTAADNGRIIGKDIFNGIFAYENTTVNFENDSIIDALHYSSGFVNNICFGKDIFIKYWDTGIRLNNSDNNQNYSIYQIIDLAFGYFISNLVEDIYISMHGQQIPETFRMMFYPIENTKEAYRIKRIDIGEL